MQILWSRTLAKLEIFPLPEKQLFRIISTDLDNFLILWTDCIKDFGVDTKLYIYQYVDFIFSHTMKLLGLIRAITLSSSTIDSLLTLYIALVRFKLEYTSVVWNYVTNTDSIKLERIQRKFAVLCHNRLFYVIHNYVNKVKKLKLSLYRSWRPLGLREVEAPTFSDIRLVDVSSTRRPLFTPRKIPGTPFC
jgi:hypothetical protein